MHANTPPPEYVYLISIYGLENFYPEYFMLVQTFIHLSKILRHHIPLRKNIFSAKCLRGWNFCSLSTPKILVLRYYLVAEKTIITTQ